MNRCAGAGTSERDANVGSTRRIRLCPGRILRAWSAFMGIFTRQFSGCSCMAFEGLSA
jgi:hypothetical protein